MIKIAIIYKYEKLIILFKKINFLNYTILC